MSSGTPPCGDATPASLNRALRKGLSRLRKRRSTHYSTSTVSYQNRMVAGLWK